VSEVDEEGIMPPMSVVRIFAIKVEEGLGEGVERLLAARAQAYLSQDGFERLELLEPTDGRPTWLFITRWADADSFDRYINSPAFAGFAAAERFGSPASMTPDIWNFRVSLDAST
jgi:heme-degrading monooxygenase HmoA